MDYSNDARLNFRKQYIENERKPVTPNMAKPVGNNLPISKIEGTKRNEIKVSNTPLSKSGSKHNDVATPAKGSKSN